MAEGFKDQTEITDVYFKQDKQNFSTGGYKVTTIGKNAFAGTTSLTGVLQLPRTITSIGDNAFAVSTPSTISQVVMGANGHKDAPVSLSVGSNIFSGRTINELHILGNFVSKTTFTSGTASFGAADITKLYYYGDGVNSDNVSEDFYDFMTAWSGKEGGTIGDNLFLPSDGIEGFVKSCKANSHQDWIPSVVRSLTFDHVMSGLGTFTFLLYSNNSKKSKGPQLGLHKVKLSAGVTDLKMDIKSNLDWEPDLMPTETNLSADISMIASNAFAGNDELRSITIIPADAITINGDAFAGAKGLRYIDFSQSELFTVVNDYTLSRISDKTNDTNTPYQYTKTTDTYDYNIVNTHPFGGLPAYTLVFLPTNINSYPSGSTETETVYKTDGTQPQTSSGLSTRTLCLKIPTTTATSATTSVSTTLLPSTTRRLQTRSTVGIPSSIPTSSLPPTASSIASSRKVSPHRCACLFSPLPQAMANSTPTSQTTISIS